MKLMGEANWWLPAWLDRRLPVIDIDGGTGPGETAPSSPTCTTPSPHAEVVTSRM
jgi:RND superfamily putative drug exporter